jgi:multimeric flavodoxin WrbA
MKKVTVFIGTSTKKATYQAALEFEKNLKQYIDIDFEYIFLKDYRLEFCQGCRACFHKGEEFCPLKDDRNILLEKMENADGIILATPNYAFQVSARMKNFLDRFAYIFHRPQFFGKTFTAIVTQGIFGGKDILKYLENMGANFGCNVTKGIYLMTVDQMTELQKKKYKQKIKKSSERFYKGLIRSSLPQPSLFRLMVFRMSRTSLQSIDFKGRDYYFYKEKNWFRSDYYYETSFGPIKKLMGYFLDFLGRQVAKNA